MILIPEPKLLKTENEFLSVKKVCLKTEDLDRRIVNAIKDLPLSDSGIPLYISIKEGEKESYKLKIDNNTIELTADGTAGAFYGVQTLKQIFECDQIPCLYIEDAPSMEYRGFYHDVTRGKVPKLETLKTLVDDMARYKLNSLQLYIEHSFDFPEYASFNKELGYLTEEEIVELDKYCRDRFIDLVPSLATFGHLYHLLQTEEYKHLSELKDHKPDKLYWIERMMHHTINPLIPESFELIKSFIDKFLDIYTSKYFNICCDETFDLCSDVNAGKDKAELYVGFVNRLVEYLESKGKTVMMWGDIVLKHPDYLDKFSPNVIFLNWTYGKNVNPDRFTTFTNYGKKQIVCPGTNSWNAFSDNIDVEEVNIGLMAQYGYENNSLGILNTNWGDFGNLCSLQMSAYGLISGATVGWNKETEFNEDFRKKASKMFYGNEEIVPLLYELSLTRNAANWHKTVWCESAREFPNPKDVPDNFASLMEDFEEKDVYINAMKTCKSVKERMEKLTFFNDDLYKEALISADGYALVVKWCAFFGGMKVDCHVDFDKWLKEYKEKWLEKNKPSEFLELERIFYSLEKHN